MPVKPTPSERPERLGSSPAGRHPLSIHQRFAVAFAYDVHFTTDLFDPANPLLPAVVNATDRPGKLLVVLDAGLMARQPSLPERIKSYARCWRVALDLRGEPLVMPGGEAAKSDPKLPERIHGAIEREGLCRHSFVLAVGGGAVLDLVGYAAATAHRGVRLIRVPTTVLAQNDAGIGVKNGINAFGKKNFLGTFAPPCAVINDSRFLETLDERDWRAGMAEAIKVALIKDAAFFAQLEADADRLIRRDMAAMRALIYRCAQLHLEHIAGSGDPFESGSSRPLDFGHWSGHRLEHLTGYRLRHGEAVAIGIALDTVYAALEGRLAPPAAERILCLLERLGFRLHVPELEAHLDEPMHPRGILRGLDEFREHLGGRLTITLLDAIGRGTEVYALEPGLVRRAVGHLAKRAGRPVGPTPARRAPLAGGSAASAVDFSCPES